MRLIWRMRLTWTEDGRGEEEVGTQEDIRCTRMKSLHGSKLATESVG